MCTLYDIMIARYDKTDVITKEGNISIHVIGHDKKAVLYIYICKILTNDN
jgi:hypothetical protein